MSELHPISLPWDYWIYQILAIIGLVPGFITATLTIQYSSSYPISFGLLHLPLIITVAIIVLYTCKRLSEGEVPIAAQFMTFYLTKNSPPNKIHRILIGTILFEVAVGLTIGVFPVYSLGLGWIGWIGTIVLMIFMVILFTGIRIPDNPPMTPSKNMEPPLPSQKPSRWTRDYVIISVVYIVGLLSVYMIAIVFQLWTEETFSWRLGWLPLELVIPILFLLSPPPRGYRTKLPAGLQLDTDTHLLSVEAGFSVPKYGFVKGTLTLTDRRLIFTPNPFFPQPTLQFSLRDIIDINKNDSSIRISILDPNRLNIDYQFLFWEAVTEVYSILNDKILHKN